MNAAWQEYTQSNVPTAEEILARKQGETVAEKLPKTKAPTQAAANESRAFDEMIAQSEADATRISQQRLQEVEEMIEKQKKEVDAALQRRLEQLQSAACDDMFHNSLGVDDMLHNSSIDDMFHHTGFDDMLGF